jgi:SAM-dependent methyltransferase
MEKKPLNANQKVNFWDTLYRPTLPSPCVYGKKFYDEMRSSFGNETDKTILDVGCGDMKYLIENKGNYLVGLDISKEALLMAKNRSKFSQNKGCDVDLVLGSADHLPFIDGCSDRVVSIETQQYMGPDYRQTLSEISRVSNKDVILTFCDKDYVMSNSMKPQGNVILDKDGYEIAFFSEDDIGKNLEEVGLEIKNKKIFTLDDLKEKSTVVPSNTNAVVYVECKKKA